MAHSTLFDHLKTKDLAKKIGEPLPHAIGHLECMWHYTAEHLPDGDLSNLTDHQIEQAAQWDGPAGVFFGAACDAGFLDRVVVAGGELLAGACPARTVRVHDWTDWCAEYVLSRRADKQASRTLVICPHCCIEFRRKRADQRYCTSRCRKAAYEASRTASGALERVAAHPDVSRRSIQPNRIEQNTIEPNPIPNPIRSESKARASAQPTDGQTRIGSETGPDSAARAVSESEDPKFARFKQAHGAWGRACAHAHRGEVREAAREFARAICGTLKTEWTANDEADVVALAQHLRASADDNRAWIGRMRACHSTALAKSETGGGYGAWRVEVSEKFGKWSVRAK